MLVAKDFRERARMSLQGNLLWAVLTGFVGSLLGASVTMLTGGGGTSANGGVSQEDMDALGQTGMGDILRSPIVQIMLAVLVSLVVVGIIWGIVCFIIGGPITLGYAQYNLKLADGAAPVFSDLFSKFGCFGQGFLLQLLRKLFIGLWSLLFVVPGIVKTYSYSMAAYIAAENPEMSASDAITESRKLMDGNKWRLFCLNISFIGWDFLCLFTLGIGNLFLRPYKEAAYASFYREIVSERLPEAAPYEENPYM